MKLGKKHKASEKVYNAYFEACENNTIYQDCIEKENGEMKIIDCFKSENTTYAVRGYDHFNGHFSGFRDQSAIFNIYVSKVIN